MQPMQRGTGSVIFEQMSLSWSYFFFCIVKHLISQYHIMVFTCFHRGFPWFSCQLVRTRSTIQEAISAKDKALLEKAYELREESRMEEENARGVVTTWSPSGHHLVTTWSPRGHHVVNLGQVDLIWYRQLRWLADPLRISHCLCSMLITSSPVVKVTSYKKR